MTSTYLSEHDGFIANDIDSPMSAGGEGTSSKRSNALSNKLTSVLSSSYADSEIRDALRLLDARGARNVEEMQGNLKLGAQKEVIEANAKIVDDFGHVAKVGA